MKPIISVLLAIFAAPLAAQVAEPPPPPPVFDPRPGPWIVLFKPGSAEFLEGYASIIEAATSSWGRVEGAPLMLCSDRPQANQLAAKQLQVVAAALREAGSPIVVSDTGWLCEQLRPFGEHLRPSRELPPDGVLIYGLWPIRSSE